MTKIKFLSLQSVKIQTVFLILKELLRKILNLKESQVKNTFYN
jgi:hypothetical protein